MHEWTAGMGVLTGRSDLMLTVFITCWTACRARSNSLAVSTCHLASRRILNELMNMPREKERERVREREREREREIIKKYIESD